MHGTTSGLSKPHDLLLRSSNNDARCIGRTRSPLLYIQEDHSGRYLGAAANCLAPTGSSLMEALTLTSSHQGVLILAIS